jgi:hypothetical protein
LKKKERKKEKEKREREAHALRRFGIPINASWISCGYYICSSPKA